MKILGRLTFGIVLAGLVLSIRPGMANPDDEVPFVRGDPNEDGVVDLSDAVFLLNHMFLGGLIPPCRPVVDINADGTLNLSDPIHLLTYLFQTGIPPTAPFPNCGFDIGRERCYRSTCPPF